MRDLSIAVASAHTWSARELLRQPHLQASKLNWTLRMTCVAPPAHRCLSNQDFACQSAIESKLQATQQDRGAERTKIRIMQIQGEAVTVDSRKDST